MSIISIENLSKNYGKHPGVRNVSFSVEKGELFGFVGPNGAGKSTTIKVLMGFIFADGGIASIDDLNVAKDAKKIKMFTGYVPSDVRLYPDMRVHELFKRNAGFYAADCSTEIERLCVLFDVDGSKRFSELSTGNKKKVSIICALMANPKVIILDEPTSGLDPVIQRMLFAELAERTEQGATVLLSSHNLSEVQEYCSRVAFIKDGSILAITDLKTETRRKIVTLSGGVEDIPAGFELISRNKDKRTFRTALTGEALLKALTALLPDDFTVDNESMEEYFWTLYGLEEKV